MNVKPRIFIGSSEEGKNYANALKYNLDSDFECAVWHQNKFELGESILGNLGDFLENYDFSAFVICSDDVIEIRNEKKFAPRDNVIFEIGLFMGGLGQENVFMVVDISKKPLRVPSDLSGIVYSTFNSKREDNNYVAALGSASLEIRNQINTITKENEINFSNAFNCVASICLRKIKKKYEVLLVGSTKNRSIFPKCRIRNKEKITKAAERCAFKEAGVIGKSIKISQRHFKYFKQEDWRFDSVTPVVLKVDSDGHSTQDFRRPRWVDVKNAERMLAENRDFDSADELIIALRWAVAEVKGADQT